MISAMPAVAVRRQRAAAALKASSRQGSLNSLPSPSTRSSSLLPSPAASLPPNYYHGAFSTHKHARRPSLPAGVGGGAHPPPPSRRPSSVSTVSSAVSNYVSALHKVRERQLDLRRERARFISYTGSVLAAAGATLVVIGLVAASTPAQTVGLLFMCGGTALWLVRFFFWTVPPPSRVLSGASIYAPSVPSSAQHSAATTPAEDCASTSSYYVFTGGRRPPRQLPLSPPPPPLQPPPVVPGVHGGHRPSSLLTPMSLNSIPEMQVLITDDSQRY